MQSRPNFFFGPNFSIGTTSVFTYYDQTKGVVTPLSANYLATSDGQFILTADGNNILCTN
jgi:hypothetical protein